MADQTDQTDHERDMERLATRLAQMNKRDAALAAAARKDGKDGKR